MSLKKLIDLDLLDRFLSKVKDLIPYKTSDLQNDSGFITGITSADVTNALGYTPPRQDTTYESKAAVSGGTAVSLVTTGEKYTWNNKGTYSKPSGGIPASDLASGVIPTVPTAYTSNPAMDGTASPGNSGNWARGDHVHPSDTSRQAKITASGILKGNGSGGVSAATAGTDYITPSTNYSKIKTVTANYSIVAGDIGQTLVVTAQNVTITVPTAIESSLPLGGEIGIMSTNFDAKLTISVPSGNGRVCVGGTARSFTTVKCPSGYSMLAIKVFGGPRIALFGDVEVVS